ncbi:MAG: hypothetical protein J1F36_00960 [Clostridiales bacterium]|nr:hypothetical protein [Clostridiales bacterium]
MIGYENKNINPKGKKTGDCVVRALSLAMGRDYVDVYRELFDISLLTGYIINDKRVEEKFLAKHGFVKHKQPKKPSGKKYLIGEIDKLCRDKVIVISCAHHLTVVLDGTLIDSWDCRGKCISNYFTLG